MEHKTIATNGCNLHVVCDGPPSAPLVILLHGFPEAWFGWRHQIPALAVAGYRVWAPDQRGYNLSDKPRDIKAYQIDTLAADIVGLIDAAQVEKAYIVGHDWGAAVAWWLALHYPERIERLAILNVPHPTVMNDFLHHNWQQQLKSWYMYFFQIPGLPELGASVGNWALLGRSLQLSSTTNIFTEETLQQYRQAWSQPHAYTSMLNWYRAALRYPPKLPDNPRISVPTLMIWGTEDQFLEREMVQPSIDLCDDGVLELLEGVSHWVNHEAPEQVNQLLQDFLKTAPINTQSGLGSISSLNSQ
ncbi:MAG: alpha/beta hydrolase [Cyanobacteria bacterium P01_F01_bin.150]